jgi:deoxyribose-phosphate aldolase
VNAAQIAALIDHTILKPEATQADISRLCDEARQYGFFSVCVNPVWVPLAADCLAGSQVKVCTVAGFPLGASATPIKAAEARLAEEQGAEEIDMVIAVGQLKSGNRTVVLEDIRAVVDASDGALVKVILETALLTDDEKKLGCELSLQAGAGFVKTSTGFAKSGATAEDIRLMRSVVGPSIGVKASGGIRTLADLERMVEAGASRIGASASIAIVGEAAR